MPRFLLKNVKVGLAWLWEGYLDEFLTGETVALLFSGVVTVERLFFRCQGCWKVIYRMWLEL